MSWKERLAKAGLITVFTMIGLLYARATCTTELCQNPSSDDSIMKAPLPQLAAPVQPDNIGIVLPVPPRPTLPPSHDPPSIQAAPLTLTAKIKHTHVLTTCSGCALQAAQIMNSAPFLFPVRTAMLSDNTFRQWIANNHHSFASQLIDKQSVVVVKGQWDHAEHVLEMAGIPHLALDADSLAGHLADADIVIINCPGALDRETLLQLKDFVGKGGYLMTTDWSLTGCLEQMFPDDATWQNAHSPSMLVDGIVVAPHDKLVRGGVEIGPWKLDSACEIVAPSNKQSVHVLVRSRILSKYDPNNLGCLALTFPYGRGKVLHLVGHFDNNTSMAFVNALPDPAPQIKISLR